MDRRNGMESHLGPGGKGGYSATEIFNKAEDLIASGGTNNHTEALAILKGVIEKDPANLDATLLAVTIVKDQNVCLNLLIDAEKAGKKKLLETLGPKAFDDDGDCVGHFWGMIETRPYMRVRKSVQELAFFQKDFKLAAETCVETIRLCPGDNMGNRNQMVPLLLYCDRKLDALKFSINWLSSDTPHQGGCDFALIKPGQIDPNCPEGSKVAKEIAKGYHDGAQLCDGALAAFLVFGDCPLARRFLKKSAAANRHILSRVLAKTKIPIDFHHGPQDLNGPEAAQDYLFMSQLIWNRPQVWSWANSVEDAKETILRVCSHPGCGKKETTPCEYKQCSGCKETGYCSRDCQLTHWNLPASAKGHKKKCMETQKMNRQLDSMYSHRIRKPR